jgi:Polyketide cyclase / dehydrase and lipid transport
MDGDVITVQKVVHAPAEAIFALVADPARHPDIDGSGSLQGAKTDAPRRLALGSTFGMSMKVVIRYSMVNTVIEFEENRRIAWQARPPGFLGRFTAGRIWRYELEPAEGGTLVKESWDLSQDHQRMFLKIGGLPDKTRKSMEKTLDRIEELTAAG